MNRALYIIDPQKGFQHSSVDGILKKIPQVAATFDGHVLVSQFFNDPDSLFHTQLGWTRFTEASDTDLLQEYQNLKSTVFSHTTYSCYTDQVKQYFADNKISEVYFAGVFTDVCITMTALETFDANIPTYIVSDLVGTLHGSDAQISSLKSLDIMLGSAAMVTSANLAHRK